MSPGDHRQPEALRGLASPQVLARRHMRHDPVLRHDDRVRGRYRGTDGVVRTQRGDAVRDDPLVDQRTGGVMQQHAAVLSGKSGIFGEAGRDGRERDPGRVRAGDPAGDHRAYLAAGQLSGEHVPDLVNIPAGHHHQDLVDPRSLRERGHATLDEGAPAERDQLLRLARAEPLPGSAAKHHRHHAHEPDSTGYVSVPGKGITAGYTKSTCIELQREGPPGRRPR
jgi:hypothetical protein